MRAPGRVLDHSKACPPTDVMVITSHPRDSNSKGDRKPDDWRGPFLSGLRSRPSGAWFRYPGSGAGSGNLSSDLCHRFSHLLRWRALSIQSSTQPSIPSHSYVVTRSRPYPARRSREVEAVSGWRLGTQPRQLGQHAVLPLPKGIPPPILDTPYSILSAWRPLPSVIASVIHLPYNFSLLPGFSH